MSERRPCPVCGCRLYQDYGPCLGDDAVAFERPGSRIKGEPIRIEARGQMDGSRKWAVVDHGAVLVRGGHWEFEPNPSSRDSAFLARARYDTLEDAESAYAYWYRANRESSKT